MNHPEVTQQALSILRSGENFQWYVITLLALVIYVYGNEISHKNWRGIDKPTNNSWGLALNFTPTWYQALPGVDLSMPMSWSQGISGNAATNFGGNRGTGTWSLGLAATVYQRHAVNLSYIRYFGDYSTGANGAAAVFNGSSAAVSDRGWVSLTLKSTF